MPKFVMMSVFCLWFRCIRLLATSCLHFWLWSATLDDRNIWLRMLLRAEDHWSFFSCAECVIIILLTELTYFCYYRYYISVMIILFKCWLDVSLQPGQQTSCWVWSYRLLPSLWFRQGKCSCCSSYEVEWWLLSWRSGPLAVIWYSQGRSTTIKASGYSLNLT